MERSQKLALQSTWNAGRRVEAKPSLVSHWRHAVAQRLTSAIVIGFFGWMQVSPALAAVKEEIKNPTQATTSAGPRTAGSAALASSPTPDTQQALEAALQKLQASLKPGHDLVRKTLKKDKNGKTYTDITIIGSPSEKAVLGAQSNLTAIADQLRKDDEVALAQFKADEAHLITHKLPQSILDRNHQAVASYQARAKEVQDRIKDLAQGTNVGAVYGQTQSLLAQLKDWRPKEAKFDPKKLPFRTSEDKAREPITDAKALQRWLTQPASQRTRQISDSGLPSAERKSPITEQQLALIESDEHSYPMDFGSVMVAGPASPIPQPGPEYLAATEDAPLSDAIKAKALELHNNPVEIYNWVRNTIDYIPSYGSIQGADLTLAALHGNAFDTASLLIALLRASNVPARYVYGVIELPAASANNWVGGTTDPDATQQLMGQGGIPNGALVSGGKTAAIRLEHVWVEAWVDFSPSRGAVNKLGDAWVPMDASYKQYDEQAPIITADVLGNIQGVAQDYLQSATVSGGGTAFTSFDDSKINTALQGMLDRLKQKIQQMQIPEYAFSTLNGARTIKTDVSPVLSASLPYRVQAIGTRFSTVPDALKVFANLSLSQDDSPLITKRLSLPQISNKSLQLGFVAASQQDQSAWDSYSTQQDFPPYLVKVKPQFSLGGQVLTTGDPMSLASDLQLRVEFQNGQNSGENSVAEFKLESGDFTQIGINGSGFTPDQGLNLFKKDMSGVEGNLYAAAQSYWIQSDKYNSVLSALHNGLITRLPSVGAFSTPLTVQYRYGIPNRASYQSRAIDIKLGHVASVSKSNNGAQMVNMMMHTGLVGSSLEGSVLEQLFGQFTGDGVSAARLIELASTQANPIYRLQPDSGSTHVGELSHSAQVISDVNNALYNGLEVIIPKNSQTIGQWRGSGYVMLDPLTGSADYRISGGRSGGEEFACEKKAVPVSVKAPQVSFIAFMAVGLVVNENFDVTFEGLAKLAFQAVLFGVLGAIGVGWVAAAFKSGRTLIASVGLFGGSRAAYAEEQCSLSCDYKVREGRLGGQGVYTLIHNACADRPEHTDFPGKDVFMEIRNFDGLKLAGIPGVTSIRSMVEIKTGKFYSTLSAIPNPPAFIEKIKAVLLLNAQFGFVRDRVVSLSCEYDYGLGLSDGSLISAMKESILSSAGGLADKNRVFNNGCQ